MKYISKIGGMLLAVMALLCTGCSTDNDNWDKLWVGFANVQLLEEHKAGTQPRFDLVIDDGTVLKVATSFVTFDNSVTLEDDTRVYVQFKRYDDYLSSDGGKVWEIELQAMVEVLTKKPIFSSAVTGNLGDAPIDLDSYGIGGRYLNLMFYTMGDRKSETKHFINLVILEDELDDSADNENKPLILTVELRHNDYGEERNERFIGFASFEIDALYPELPTVGFKIRYTNYDGRTLEVGPVYYNREEVAAPDNVTFIGRPSIEKFY